MKVEVRSKEIVRPSSPTPQSLKSYKLSFLDQLALNVKIPDVIFYDSPGAYSHDFINTIDELKKSLSKTLSLMYPLAGRVKEDKVTVECNDEGVEFIVADVADEIMSCLLENPDEMEKIKHLIPNAKVNRFSCGGMAIGFFVSHAIADGLIAAIFFETWGSINRGCDVNGNGFVSDQPSILFPPLTDTSAVERSVKMAAEAIEQEDKTKVIKRFVIPADAVAQLREELICKENNKGFQELICKENNKGAKLREELICKENNKGFLSREELICKENNKGSMKMAAEAIEKEEKDMVVKRFLIPSNAIAQLREELICKENNKGAQLREELICKENNKGLRRPSRTEAITALVWAAVINAAPPTQTVTLSCMVDLRGRMEPPLPPNCLGNLTYGATAHPEAAKDGGAAVTAAQLVEKIRDSLRAVNDGAARKMYGEGGLLRAAFVRGHEMVRNKDCSTTTLYTSSLFCVDNRITKLILGGGSQDWW
nr:vinorine synthase-like [Ipomoea batatas]